MTKVAVYAYYECAVIGVCPQLVYKVVDQHCFMAMRKVGLSWRLCYF